MTFAREPARRVFAQELRDSALAFREHLAERASRRRKNSAAIFNGIEIIRLAERYGITESDARQIMRSQGWQLGRSWSGSRQVWYPPGSKLPYNPVG